MDTQQSWWELLILDADPGTTGLGCLTAGDLDSDGNEEIVTGGAGALLWGHISHAWMDVKYVYLWERK